MTRPVALALSPHLDDAAFSAGGTLATLVGAGWRIVMATAFTRSVPDPQGFALACQLDKGLEAGIDYMALRREEDGDAAQALGVWPPVWLDLPEAPHRGYDDAAALFRPPHPADDALLPPLAAALAELADETAPDLILAPQAIGAHVDHVQLVRALDRAALSAPILWWRDFPYMDRTADPPEPFRDRFGALPEIVVALDDSTRASKRAACAAYRSQLGFQFGGETGLDARLAATGGRERFRLTGRVPADAAALLRGRDAAADETIRPDAGKRHP